MGNFRVQKVNPSDVSGGPLGIEQAPKVKVEIINPVNGKKRRMLSIP
jgi:hypothetical protein